MTYTYETKICTLNMMSSLREAPELTAHVQLPIAFPF